MAKVVSYTGLVSTWRMLGAAATTHNLFTIENTAGSAVLVGIRRLVCQLDATALLTAVMPQVKASRIAIPTGGTLLNKVAFDTAESSAANVNLRGANASDGGVISTITATPGDCMWQQYAMRMHTVVGQVLAPDNPLVPTLCENSPVILRANQALLVQVVTPTAANNPATNHWFVQCVWEEFTIT